MIDLRWSCAAVLAINARYGSVISLGTGVYTYRVGDLKPSAHDKPALSFKSQYTDSPE